MSSWTRCSSPSAARACGNDRHRGRRALRRREGRRPRAPTRALRPRVHRRRGGGCARYPTRSTSVVMLAAEAAYARARRYSWLIRRRSGSHTDRRRGSEPPARAGPPCRASRGRSSPQQTHAERPARFFTRARSPAQRSGWRRSPRRPARASRIARRSPPRSCDRELLLVQATDHRVGEPGRRGRRHQRSEPCECPAERR